MSYHMRFTHTALIAATALALTASTVGVASAREGNAPLAHWGGCARFVTADYGANDWECQGPGDQSSGTVGDGTWVEVRYPGWCITSTGVKKIARPFRHETCA